MTDDEIKRLLKQGGLKAVLEAYSKNKGTNYFKARNTLRDNPLAPPKYEFKPLAKQELQKRGEKTPEYVGLREQLMLDFEGMETFYSAAALGVFMPLLVFPKMLAEEKKKE